VESTAVMPAECEEEAYRLRNVRMAEKGFLPLEEAVGIYQPVPPGAAARRSVPRPKRPAFGDLPVPVRAYTMLEGESLFARAARSPSNADILDRLQLELTSVCNRVATADRQTLRSRKEMEAVVRKAEAMIGLGLERVLEGEGRRFPKTPEEGVRAYALETLFRVGWSAVAELKRRAQAWLRDGWFRRMGLPLTFWGEQWMGVIGGLLLRRPRVYDPETPGGVYRDFRSMEDVAVSAAVLAQAVAMDGILGRMSPDLPEKAPEQPVLTFKNLVLTLWARRHLSMPPPLRPVPLHRFRVFYRDLWSAPLPPRTVRPGMRKGFLDGLSDQCGLSAEALTLRVGPTLDTLLAEIEGEMGAVSEETLDPRFVPLFLIEPSPDRAD
jgi:hypothetical protein